MYFVLSVLLTCVGLFVGPCSSLGGPKGTYSNTWLLKTDANRDLIQRSSADNGFKTIANPFPGYYVLERDDVSIGSRQRASLSSRVTTMANTMQAANLQQLMYHNHSTRASLYKVSSQSDEFNITDSQWADMWHAQTSQYPSMGIYDAWVDGYSGVGVHVTLLDDGIEPTHIDLAANYDESLSYDYFTDSQYVYHTGSDSHGTECAGLVAAVKNDHCVIGTAYRSTISAVKILNSSHGLTDYGESLALTTQLASTDIYSNSWGPLDTGALIFGPGELTQEALRRGVTEGRGGKGVIYTFAAGNGGQQDDDCNCNGYSNNIYTISVTSVGTDRAPAFYSEECSNIMVGTYSGDSPDLTIATTYTNDQCTTTFQGTSASCPIAAGIIALVLEANPNLTWRDVQHLIVETSETDGLVGANWQTNGAGKRVSHSFGFGLMNAANMIQRAKNWTNVPAQVVCTGPLVVVDETSYASSYGSTITSEHVSDGCSGSIDTLEHVQVWISFESTYRGRIEIIMYSPNGMASRLLHERPNDSNSGTLEWTFMTLFTWGENPTGTWRLVLETAYSVVFTLNSWRITMYGTQEQISTTAGPVSTTGSLMSTTAGMISTTGAQISQEPVQPDDSNNVGLIAGGVIGGVALLAIIAVVVYCMDKKPEHTTVHPISQTPINGGYQTGIGVTPVSS